MKGVASGAAHYPQAGSGTTTAAQTATSEGPQAAQPTAETTPALSEAAPKLAKELSVGLAGYEKHNAKLGKPMNVTTGELDQTDAATNEGQTQNAQQAQPSHVDPMLKSLEIDMPDWKEHNEQLAKNV